MNENRGSYREAFKSFNIFGGVQMFDVAVDFVRSKVLSLLLGPGGMGLQSLIKQPIDFIWTASSLGINVTGIREIAAANSEGDSRKISSTIRTVRRWSTFSGFLGMAITICLSVFLFNLTFTGKADDIDSRFSGNWTIFVFLSVILLITSINSGQSAIMYGTRQVKNIAVARLLSSFFGLLLSLPFYYFWGLNGIVPALITIASIQLFFSWHFSRKFKIEPNDITMKQSYLDGRNMVKQGILFSISTLAVLGANYLLSLFLNSVADKDTVGLYTTGWGLTNKCVGLVFTAIAADYFPRLCEMIADNRKMANAVNHQADIALLIVAPLMILYISFLPLIIQLLTSSAFLPTVGFVQWFILGMLFKTASWALSYVFLAKGDNGLYLTLELVTNALFVALNIVGYMFFGLEGMGMAFVALYVAYFILQVVICKKKYGITFYSGFRKLFAVQFVLSAACFFCALTGGYPFTYFAGSILFAVSAIYSFQQLDRRLELKAGIMSKLRKKQQ